MRPGEVRATPVVTTSVCPSTRRGTAVCEAPSRRCGRGSVTLIRVDASTSRASLALIADLLAGNPVRCTRTVGAGTRFGPTGDGPKPHLFPADSAFRLTAAVAGAVAPGRLNKHRVTRIAARQVAG
jgi:hypothetical protein